MRVDLSVTGDKELERMLRSLPAALSRRVQVNALKEGAEPIRASASSLAPRDEQAGAPHLADNIIVDELSKRELDEESLFDGAAVAVGPAAPFFYGYMQEVGTAHHAAQPFMRPAFDSNWRRSLRIVGISAWQAIRKHLGRGGSSGAGRNL